MKISTSIMTAVAAAVLVVGISGCGGGQDDTVAQPAQKAGLVELAAPTPTDDAAAEAAAEEQADAAAAAKATADAEAKADAAAKAKATATAKAKAAAKAKAKAAAAAKAKAAAAAAAEEEESRDVYYENCTAVRAAGADPIRRGDPGYSVKLDRDQDGIGCE